MLAKDAKVAQHPEPDCEASCKEGREGRKSLRKMNTHNLRGFKLVILMERSEESYWIRSRILHFVQNDKKTCERRKSLRKTNTHNLRGLN
jgi:hypothetical protein